MMEQKNLSAKNYYSLTYSVIPDNKIQQVIGTYTQYVYDVYTDITSDTYDSYTYTYVDGHTGTGTLPMYDPDVQDKYEDTYREVTSYESHGSGYETANRTEKVAVEYTLSIFNNVPFIFSDVSLTDVTGELKTRSGTNQTGTDVFWTYFFSEGNVLYAPFCINMAGGAGTTTTDDLTTGEIQRYEIDPYWDGKKLDGEKYRMDLKVYVYVINNTLYRHEKVTGVDATITQGLINSFKISVNILGVRTETVDFEKHVDVLNYGDYPLRVTGNEYTNMMTYYEDANDNHVPWHEWVSDQILNKYKSGKIFINAKIKGSYLVENNIGIGSSLVIKDINNMYITIVDNVSHKLAILSFAVVNIEYDFDDASFDANVTLLEDGAIYDVLNYVVMSNGTRVVNSENIKIININEEDDV